MVWDRKTAPVLLGALAMVVVFDVVLFVLLGPSWIVLLAVALTLLQGATVLRLYLKSRKPAE